MTTYPKVLVAIPTYSGKHYIFEKNFECIKNIDYPNFEYVYIDNSMGTGYAATLRRYGANAVHVPRGDNSRQALCNSQNYAREKAINEGFDYLMFIESDLLPKPDCIWRLLSYNKPVVGALYYLGTEDQPKVPCIFVTANIPGQGMGTRPLRADETPKFINRGLQLVHGIGLGCAIIRSDIFSKFIFWYDERRDDAHSDVYFYMELHNAGIPVFADTNYLVEHRPSKWSEVKDR